MANSKKINPHSPSLALPSPSLELSLSIGAFTDANASLQAFLCKHSVCSSQLPRRAEGATWAGQ